MDKNILLERLISEFEKKKKQNPSYSLRALSRDSSIGQSVLSRLLSGKREMTPQLAFKLGTYLKLSKEDLCQLILSTLE